MRNNRIDAIRLRKEGRSYREINRVLGTPLGTLSGWLAPLEWSREVGTRLRTRQTAASKVRLLALNRSRGEKLKRAYAVAAEEARAELANLKYDPLFIAGIMLYWAEGEKHPRRAVKFTSSDTEMIRFFNAFLLSSCGVPPEKIRARLIIYPEHEEFVTRAYWSKASGIPAERFSKSVRIAGRRPARRLSWGVCTISVPGAYFKHKMLEWIRLLPRELIDRDRYENILPSRASDS